MPRVLCALPNASELISGVKFSPTDGGMLSEEIDAAMVEQFVAIPGYQAVESSTSTVAPPAAPVAPATVELPPVPAEPVGAEQGTVPAPSPEAPAEDPVDPADDPANESADALAALRAEAESLGITVNNRWGEKRLQAEIAAKKAAA